MQKLLQSKLSLIIADKFDLAVVVTSSSVYCEFETVQSKCMIQKQVKQLVQFAVSYLFTLMSYRKHNRRENSC